MVKGIERHGTIWGESGSDIYKVFERNKVSKDPQVETEKLLAVQASNKARPPTCRSRNKALRSREAGQRASCPLQVSWDHGG